MLYNCDEAEGVEIQEGMVVNHGEVNRREVCEEVYGRLLSLDLVLSTMSL